MPETVSQTASLIGQVIEDVTYEALRLHQFTAELVGVRTSPQYKHGGFFVFSNLRAGGYVLRILGEPFQPQEYTVSVPLQSLIFDSPPTFEVYPMVEAPGENELVVVVKTMDVGGNRIFFDPVILKKAIRAEVPVLAAGFGTRLAAELDMGRVSEARLDDVSGLTIGAIVRIVRDRSVRLKFNPYVPLPLDLTRIVGKVVVEEAPERALEGAQVRVTQVNGADVVVHDIAGAQIATMSVGGTAVVLGAEKDLVTSTNRQGDYNCYFRQGLSVGSVTLEASLVGYLAQTRTIAMTQPDRNVVDFELARP